ncbi:hypothetical protein ABZ260_02465, partial [Streptosporangium sp. NPDC006013]|uniref:hypothetical protein n=1 Tax=Streptosporangium sp. NPDC006013 TaxID=3155596 RepID=UPI0033A4F890
MSLPRVAGTAPKPFPAVPLTWTVAVCHSDHGLATPDDVDARTRQRTSQPSFSLPDVTVGVCSEQRLQVEHEPLDTCPLSLQISPVPCPAADGS